MNGSTYKLLRRAHAIGVERGSKEPLKEVYREYKKVPRNKRGAVKSKIITNMALLAKRSDK